MANTASDRKINPQQPVRLEELPLIKACLAHQISKIMTLLWFRAGLCCEKQEVYRLQPVIKIPVSAAQTQRHAMESTPTRGCKRYLFSLS